jgi:phosphoserine phosphatase SerB
MKPKIVFFDMDGVLFDVGYFENGKNVSASSWKILADAIGAGKDEDALKEKWKNNELKHFLQWVHKTIEIYKAHGLTKNKFDEIINSIPLMPGAKETVAELKKRGYLTCVITGSFKELAYRARKELGIDFIVSACEFVFDPKGQLVDYIAFPSDYNGKVKFFETIISGLGIKPEETVMVGDGVNDIQVAEEAGFSIAFNARNELKEHCDAVVDKKDLREILRLLQ